ncbi:MAG: type II secretion system protein [Phycisphaerales bacterium]
MNNKKTMSSNRAFTLVELLVVISIIAMLLAILMPSLQKAKQQAESVICKTRLNDIGKALSLYAVDNSDAIPPSGLSKAEDASTMAENDGIWMRRLVKYYGILKGKKPPLSEFASFKLLRCPSQKTWQKAAEDLAASKKIQENLNSVYSMYRGCYALNFYFQYEADNPNWPKAKDSTGRILCAFRRYSQIKQPGGFPLISDVSGDIPVDFTGDRTAISCSILFPQMGPHPIASKFGWKGSTFLRGPAPVHNGKTNYLMGDMHSETKGVWPWQPPIANNNSAPDFHPRRARAGTPGYYP